MTDTNDAAVVVLIVEDEPLVQAMAFDVLEDAGHRPLLADRAAQAMQILERDPSIDILFTDVRMPGSMDGKELAAVAHLRWPALRIIITSGHAPEGFSDIPEGSVFLPKPYRPTELEAALRQVWGKQQADGRLPSHGHVPPPSSGDVSGKSDGSSHQPFSIN